MKMKFVQVWVFISTYRPVSEREKAEKEAFWKDVDKCVQSWTKCKGSVVRELT